MNTFNNNSIIQTLHSINYLQHTQKLMVRSCCPVCSAEHVCSLKGGNQVSGTSEGSRGCGRFSGHFCL